MLSYIEKNVIPILQKTQGEFDAQLSIEDLTFIQAKREELSQNRAERKAKHGANRSTKEEHKAIKQKVIQKKTAPKTTLDDGGGWGDMDDFGHVNNIIYLKWCETSRVELFREVWNLKSLKMEDILAEEGMGPILANFNMNYRIPVEYPDIITVKTRVTSIGNTSFGISHELYSKVNGKNIVANAESVVVMINYKQGKKISINDNNRSKLKQFFGGPDRI